MVDEEGGCRDLALFTWKHLGTPCVQDQGRVGRLEGEVSVNNVARLEHAYSASLFVGRCKCVTGGYYSMVSCLVRQSIGHSCNRLIIGGPREALLRDRIRNTHETLQRCFDLSLYRRRNEPADARRPNQNIRADHRSHLTSM